MCTTESAWFYERLDIYKAKVSVWTYYSLVSLTLTWATIIRKSSILNTYMYIICNEKRPQQLTTYAVCSRIVKPVQALSSFLWHCNANNWHTRRYILYNIYNEKMIKNSLRKYAPNDSCLLVNSCNWSVSVFFSRK